MREVGVLGGRTAAGVPGVILLDAGLAAADPHSVKRPVYESDGDDEENGGQQQSDAGRQAGGQLDGEEAEERGEFDDRVHGDGGGVLEGIADGVADDGGGMKRGSLLAQFDFDDFFCVIPGAAGVGHEDGLEKAERRHGN